MNGEYLFAAMANIRPSYIDEAEKQAFPKPLRRRLLPLAACLAVVLSLSLGFFHLLANGMPAAAEPPETLQEATLSPPAVEEVEGPETAPGDAIDRIYENPSLLSLLLLYFLDDLLAIAALAVPLIAILRKKKSRKIPAASLGLYLAYLTACICYVLVTVHLGSWAELQQNIRSMLVGSMVLLAAVLVLNGLTCVPKRWLAVLLALAVLGLLLLFSAPDHSLIDPDAVANVESERQEQVLVTYLNLAGGERTAYAPEYQFEAWTVATITMNDGSFYELQYVYDNGFSFDPFPFGEDSAHYDLTRYDSGGNPTAAWTMAYEFESLYR